MLLKSSLLAIATFGLMTGSAMALPFTNGDFETGDLSGWQLTRFTDASEATVVNSPDVMTGYYAKLNDSDSNGIASIYQSFDIDPSATFVDISFDYYFDGEDTASWYSDVFLSTFAFKSGDNYTGWLDLFDWDLKINTIVTSNGTLGSKVSYSTTYAISLVDESPNAMIQFGLFESDGWCFDKTDTWLGVDNIQVSTTAPVPEPATMLLFGAGLVGLAGVRAKRMKK